MSVLPRIIFDTTAINALEDGGSDSEALMQALLCGCDVTHQEVSIPRLRTLSLRISMRSFSCSPNRAFVLS